ncbi:MAG: hypothetical protein M1402_04565 [Candidatus Thermoplasmatota archaeon]|nr:hypothetical protein [Candidatus Thermoplasmatota archaeon]MCL5666079.1 hypothetical protein [Candidatus Thermoplasmatota archaeon]
MKFGALQKYYTSMIIYMIGSIPLILYGLIIKPIADLYHENPSVMVSPVFGNYYDYLNDLFYASIIIVTVSLFFMLYSFMDARKAGKKIATRTWMFPLLLYIFAYVLLGVVGPA